MERPLLLLVISSLLSRGSSLSCHQCMPSDQGPCTDTKVDCPTQCGSLRVVAYAGGQMVSDMSMKNCVVPQQCITGSLNVGLMKTVINSKCCKIDNCNAQEAPATTGGPNGKECYTCVGADCSGKMKCEGVEDQCISAFFDAGGTKMAVKGCASKSVCSGDLAQQLGSALEKSECCQGNMCNGAGGSGRSAGGGAGAVKSSAAITVGLAVVLSLLFH